MRAWRASVPNHASTGHNDAPPGGGLRHVTTILALDYPANRTDRDRLWHAV